MSLYSISYKYIRFLNKFVRNKVKRTENRKKKKFGMGNIINISTESFFFSFTVFAIIYLLYLVRL